MRFDIVGGGAIGLLYGARLALAGHPITIWTRTVEQAEKLADDGIELVREGTITIADVEAFPLKNCSRSARQIDDPDRVVLVAVKQTQLTDALIKQITLLAGQDTIVIGLQNGIGHAEKLYEALPHADVMTAVTTEGALRHGPRTVEHTGTGLIAIGEAIANEGRKSASNGEPIERMKPSEQEIRHKMLLDAFSKAGITAELSNEMNNRIFQKLLVNAVINPLTALFDVRNGELPKQARRAALMRALYEETHQVLAAAGMHGDEDRWQQVLQVCERTAGNISSMLADVQAGRQTEIDWINGSICRIAAQYGLEAPLNASMVQLVRAMNNTVH
ncbi:2-dehydropantoate 2-reductase [Paenibacillus cellulosilyticus]|uniref:2-dehydropantoate 2-reductase n=1 Tax=Paenibacillus cellulosilyticus TaxID=375489 RepID=A0A2V2YNG9_9BACL|nr:2-dehydropantoate 2-reductase [Paenibacillus cellulosilyticus]PWV95452.1 2-dehydropantoate 2-reductase [Paenibacillus cellulosilyticus]QKS43173.1 2-dehydropantoate 2-reductase [Paenibacillus cellulosilyticus]